MNHDANIDSMINAMGRPQELQTIKFSEEEVKSANSVHKLVNSRIYTLMSRKTLTELDIKLLDVLLKAI